MLVGFVAVNLCSSLLRRSGNEPSGKNEDLHTLLRDFLSREASRRNPVPTQANVNLDPDLEHDLDPESEAENEAERQSVDLPDGHHQPTNIHPYNKTEHKAELLDRHRANNKFQFLKRLQTHSVSRNFGIKRAVWRRGVIPYTIDEDSYGNSKRLAIRLIKGAVDIIQRESCVRWVERTTQKDYVVFQNQPECSSYIGRIGGMQTISLDADGCLEMGTVLHEMLHCMGAIHEQSRSDRADNIRIRWDNTQPSQSYNFDMGYTVNDRPYDLWSLMQYGLKDFGLDEEKKTMELQENSLEYLTTNIKDNLDLNDISEINEAYQCIKDCQTQCKYGGVVKQSGSVCSCVCPDGLQGADCSQLNTTTGCGGIMYVTDEMYFNISLHNYDTGLLCTWLIIAPTGKRVKATILDMDLPSSSKYDCYHWLEFRDYLIGAPGKEKCGTVGGAVFRKAIHGDPSVMMIRFNSLRSRTPGRGFDVKLEAYSSGCVSRTCLHGGDCLELENGGFHCRCKNGFSGATCNYLSAKAMTSCSFNDDFQSCVFAQEADSEVNWTLSSYGIFPGNRAGHPYLIIFAEDFGKEARLKTHANFETSNRCLHFRYFFASTDEEAGDSEISVHYRGSSANKWTHLQSFKGSEFASWTYEFASLDIPPVDGLQLYLRYVAGYHKTILDEIAVLPGKCDDWVCYDNPCTHGGTCESLEPPGEFICHCKPGFSGPTCNEVTADATIICTLDRIFEECIFYQESISSEFVWQTQFQKESGRGEILQPPFLYTAEFEEMDARSFLDINVDLTEAERCLEFQFVFFRPSERNKHSEIRVEYPDPDTNDWEVLGSFSGDDKDKTTAALTLPAIQNLQITIVVIARKQRVAIDNILLRPGQCDQTEKDANFACTFEEEENNCFLEDFQNDDFDWKRKSGRTGSRYTGPQAAEQGDYYVYTESSRPQRSGDVAILESNAVFEDKRYCFRMFYHMLGEHMGTLLVKTKTDDGEEEVHFEKSGNVGKNWNRLELNLDLKPGSKILIEGVVGSGYQGDMALDNISLTSCYCSGEC